MKQTLLTLVLMLLPMLASADAVEIGGIYYNLDTEAKTAEVTSNPNYYSGSVVIPEKFKHEGTEYSVTSIGYKAFNSCWSLTSVNIPNSVTSIGEGAFYGCMSLKSITIPNSVISIGSSAFNGCSGLTSVNIPNSVTSIGKSAFGYCSRLTSIIISSSVTSIEGDAFEVCQSLTSIIVESGNTKYDSRDNCNAIIETESNTLIAGCKNTIIPNSVTSIGNRAFNYCTGLTSITIPNSVTSIGGGAFALCSGLTSITIGSSVTSIGSGAFSSCSGLTSITIPSSVTSIGFNAFSSCRSLTSITIPSSVTWIDLNAFQNCSGLTSIKVESGNMKYDSRDNCNAIIETESNKLIVGCKNTTIPNSVTSIGNYAFSGCTGLTSITIPNSVTSIGDKAFSGCSGLTSIIIPNSVTSIKYQVFSDCSGLLNVYCYAIIVPETNEYAFYTSNIAKATLHVPTESVSDYKASSPWNQFKEIVAISDVTIGDANGDGVVDVADVVEIVNFILEKPSEKFVEAAADANDDKVIDTADVVAVVNIILKGGNGNSARVRAILEANGFIF